MSDQIIWARSWCLQVCLHSNPKSVCILSRRPFQHCYRTVLGPVWEAQFGPQLEWLALSWTDQVSQGEKASVFTSIFSLSCPWFDASLSSPHHSQWVFITLNTLLHSKRERGSCCQILVKASGRHYSCFCEEVIFFRRFRPELLAPHVVEHPVSRHSPNMEELARG